MKGRQGFASMDPAKVREIAGKGGKAAHKKGTAHTWTSETARAAGRKGGRSSAGRKEAKKEEASERRAETESVERMDSDKG